MGDLVRRFVPMGQRRLVDPSAWNPSLVRNCILYGGAYLEARATRGAQPVLVDGDMEAADTAAWAAYNSAALSKQVGSPGGVGSRVLRVTEGAVNFPYAGQDVFTVGNRYRLKPGGYGRSDGVLQACLGFSIALDSWWSGTTSAGWVAIPAKDLTSVAARFAVAGYGGAAGNWAEFDNLAFENLSLASYTPQFTTVAGSVLAQATATAQPWVSSDGLGIRFAPSDYLAWSAPAGSVNCLHNGAGGTLVVAVRPDAITVGDNALIETCQSDLTKVGCLFRYSSSGNVVLYVLNGSGVASIEVASAAPVVAGQTYVYVVRIASGANGVTIYQNNVLKYTGTLGAVSAADASLGLRIGGANIDGKIGHVGIYDRVLTVAEAQQITNYILAQATL